MGIGKTQMYIVDKELGGLNLMILILKCYKAASPVYIITSADVLI